MVEHQGETVYPRVGGGTAAASAAICHLVGLSPRGRGNHPQGMHDYPLNGSIPAWAGEPAARAPTSLARTVYPRVGGGTGLPDQGRAGARGLSPRGRGNRLEMRPKRAISGSIPAWAGEPLEPPADPHLGKVYPRVGGGTFGERRIPTVKVGLSPRGRGNPDQSTITVHVKRSIPAWAGEPQTLEAGLWEAQVYPRVGGGT